MFNRFVIVLSLAGLFCWVFAEPLFSDQNFVYRDATQYYYPIFKLVRDEWSAGRWALWNPYENGGSPLLANPTASVLYPVRVVLFQWLPLSYGVAFKWYVLLHVLGAAGSMYALARHWRASECGAGLASVAYSFGSIVLFQYCNVVYLVSAAWVPLAWLAADKSLRAASWSWTIGLGAILAVQVFGGDPEAAYLCGVFAALYVAVLDPPFSIGLLGLLAALSAVRGAGEKATLFAGLAAAFAVRLSPVGTVDTSPARRGRIARLAIAAAIAGGLGAVQLLPAAELNRLSLRASPDGSPNPYSFQVPLWRLPELIWPGVSGRQLPVHSRWIEVPASRTADWLEQRTGQWLDQHARWSRLFPNLDLAVRRALFDDRPWQPSLYCGVVPVLLGVAGWRIRRAVHATRWLSLVALVTLLGSFGRSCGVYWLLMEALPGFDAFRYPAKLLTYTAAAMSLLAAFSFDRWTREADGGIMRRLGAAAIVSGVLLALVVVARPTLLAWWQSSPLSRQAELFGPLQCDRAWRHLCGAFAQTSAVLVVVILIARLGRSSRFASCAPAAVLAVVAIDLGLANRWLILCDAQQELDAEPALARLIREHDRTANTGLSAVAIAPAQPRKEAAGPLKSIPTASSYDAVFRVHRTALHIPSRWTTTSSPQRHREVFRWRRDTLQPNLGQHVGIRYAIVHATLEPYDYWWFFAPFPGNASSDAERTFVYARRGFDLWGARYFVLPHGRVDDARDRAIRTFLPNTQLLTESPLDADDFQVRFNEHAYPRAWIVHRVLQRQPVPGFDRTARNAIMREILYPGFDGVWREADLDSRRAEFDPRAVAWIEHPDSNYVARLAEPPPADSTDRCSIVGEDPEALDLDVETTSAGVLVVAEVLFPGWSVTVDGQSAEILRTNRIMRGVRLAPGRHRVAFRYDPRSVRVGATISLGTLLATIVFMVHAACRRRIRPAVVGGAKE